MMNSIKTINALKKIIGFIILALTMVCCNPQNEAIGEDSPVYFTSLEVDASSSKIPLNCCGISYLRALTNWENDVRLETVFYINGSKMESNAFKPTAIGSFMIKGVHKGIESPEIEILVEEPRNRKVLLEYFTSRTCGFCPWIGFRVDSLHHTNDKIIGYSIHGQDELAISEGVQFEEYSGVSGRPSLRINRGVGTRIIDRVDEVIDSINYTLSFQPEVELAINSNLNQDNLKIEVFGKYYEEIDTELFLTVLVVEDKIITENQYNFCNDSGFTDCPYHDDPHPIPMYENHNTLRKFLTDVKGDETTSNPVGSGEEILIKSFQETLSNINVSNIEETFIIAFLHKRKDGHDTSELINAQIVKLGENISFED